MGEGRGVEGDKADRPAGTGREGSVVGLYKNQAWLWKAEESLRDWSWSHAIGLKLEEDP